MYKLLGFLLISVSHLTAGVLGLQTHTPVGVQRALPTETSPYSHRCHLITSSDSFGEGLTLHQMMSNECAATDACVKLKS